MATKKSHYAWTDDRALSNKPGWPFLLWLVSNTLERGLFKSSCSWQMSLWSLGWVRVGGRGKTEFRAINCCKANASMKGCLGGPVRLVGRVPSRGRAQHYQRVYLRKTLERLSSLTGDFWFFFFNLTLAIYTIMSGFVCWWFIFLYPGQGLKWSSFKSHIVLIS